MADKLVGKVTHYYEKIGVAVISVQSALSVGDQIKIKAPAGSPRETDFTQAVSSMQVEHQSVTKAKKGDDIGLKVDQAVKDNDQVFLLA